MRERSAHMNRLPVIALVIILLAASTWIVVAAPNDLSLTWWSIDSGGGESAGGTYQLFSTLGQPEAGVVAGGTYTLSGGVAGKTNPNELSLTWWSVNSGGGESTGGTYQLFSTLGQPEAGVVSGGNFTIRGGFIGKAQPTSKSFYLPLITQ